MVMLKMTHWISGEQLWCWVGTTVEEQNGDYPAWPSLQEDRQWGLGLRKAIQIGKSGGFWGETKPLRSHCYSAVTNCLWKKARNGPCKGWQPLCWYELACQPELAGVSTVNIAVTALLMTSVDVSNDTSFYSTCIDKTTGNDTLKKNIKMSLIQNNKAFLQVLKCQD